MANPFQTKNNFVKKIPQLKARVLNESSDLGMWKIALNSNFPAKLSLTFSQILAIYLTNSSSF